MKRQITAASTTSHATMLTMPNHIAMRQIVCIFIFHHHSYVDTVDCDIQDRSRSSTSCNTSCHAYPRDVHSDSYVA